MSKSELEKQSKRDYSGALRFPSEQAAFVDGALHLLEVADQWCKSDKIEDTGGIEYHLLTFLKSYCGREG